jgi:hypothetical protein
MRRAASTWLTIGKKKQRDLDEALVLGGEGDRLLLVLVEGERLPVRAEDVGAAWIEDAVLYQGLDVRRAPVARIDLNERLWPVALLAVDGRDLLADVLGVDRREGRREVLVLIHDAVAEGEDVERRCGPGLGHTRHRCAALGHRLPRRAVEPPARSRCRYTVRSLTLRYSATCRTAHAGEGASLMIVALFTGWQHSTRSDITAQGIRLVSLAARGEGWFGWSGGR